MTVITFENPENAEPIPECMICCQDILDGECVSKEYHCTHIFHEECLNEWLHISFMCPACKAFIYEPPAEVVPLDRRLQAMREEWSSRVIEGDQLDRDVLENRWRKYLEMPRLTYVAPQNENPDQQLASERSTEGIGDETVPLCKNLKQL